MQYYAAFEQLVVDVDMMEAGTTGSDRGICVALGPIQLLSITIKTKLYQSGPVKDNSYTGDEVMNTFSSQVYVETEGWPV